MPEAASARASALSTSSIASNHARSETRRGTAPGRRAPERGHRRKNASVRRPGGGCRSGARRPPRRPRVSRAHARRARIARDRRRSPRPRPGSTGGSRAASAARGRRRRRRCAALESTVGRRHLTRLERDELVPAVVSRSRPAEAPEPVLERHVVAHVGRVCVAPASLACQNSIMPSRTGSPVAVQQPAADDNRPRVVRGTIDDEIGEPSSRPSDEERPSVCDGVRPSAQSTCGSQGRRVTTADNESKRKPSAQSGSSGRGRTG